MAFFVLTLLIPVLNLDPEPALDTQQRSSKFTESLGSDKVISPLDSRLFSQLTKLSFSCRLNFANPRFPFLKLLPPVSLPLLIFPLPQLPLSLSTSLVQELHPLLQLRPISFPSLLPPILSPSLTPSPSILNQLPPLILLLKLELAFFPRSNRTTLLTLLVIRRLVPRLPLRPKSTSIPPRRAKSDIIRCLTSIGISNQRNPI